MSAHMSDSCTQSPTGRDLTSIPPEGSWNDLDRDEQENRKGFVSICSVCHKLISELLHLIFVVGISAK